MAAVGAAAKAAAEAVSQSEEVALAAGVATVEAATVEVTMVLAVSGAAARMVALWG